MHLTGTVADVGVPILVLSATDTRTANPLFFMQDATGGTTLDPVDAEDATLIVGFAVVDGNDILAFQNLPEGIPILVTVENAGTSDVSLAIPEMGSLITNEFGGVGEPLRAGQAITFSGLTVDLGGTVLIVALGLVIPHHKTASFYTNDATHAAGTTISIPGTVHALRPGRALQVQVQDAATGCVEIPDICITAGGDVTITYAAPFAVNSKLVTITG
jgi:hypothetical protein